MVGNVWPSSSRFRCGTCKGTSRRSANDVDRHVRPAGHVCHRDAPQARGVHPVFGHQVEHHVERDLAFHPGEGRAEAAVDAVPEIEVVPGRYPVDIESVGFAKVRSSRVAEPLISMTTLLAGMVVPCSVTSRVL